MRSPIRRSAVILSLLLAPAAGLGAQTSTPPEGEIAPGARVRVTQTAVSPPKLVGTLVAAEGGTLSVLRERAESPLSLPVASVRRLEVSQGRHPVGGGFGDGARKGLIGGLAVSSVLLALAAVEDRDGSDGHLNKKAAALLFAVPITLTTTTVGGLVGAARRERWVRVPIPPPPALIP